MQLVKEKKKTCQKYSILKNQSALSSFFLGLMLLGRTSLEKPSSKKMFTLPAGAQNSVDTWPFSEYVLFNVGQHAHAQSTPLSQNLKETV